MIFRRCFPRGTVALNPDAGVNNLALMLEQEAAEERDAVAARMRASALGDRTNVV